MKREVGRLISSLITAALVFTSVPLPAYAVTDGVMAVSEADMADIVAMGGEAVSDEEELAEAVTGSEVISEEGVLSEEEALTDTTETDEDGLSEENEVQPYDEETLPEEEDDLEEFREELIPDGLYDVPEGDITPDSGTETGTGIAWSIDAEGTLTLSGTGATRDYNNTSSGFSPNINDRPWKAYTASAKKIVVDEGITRIGDRAFQGFKNLTTVELPNSLESIGRYAFQNCTVLDNVNIPKNVTLETGAFENTPAEIELLAVENEEYRKSKYYKQLIETELTGNYRHDVIAIARSQIGYHEGDNEADYGGGNTSGSKDYTEYGRYLNSAGNAWCSEFASWCIREAGVPAEIINNSRGANADTFTKNTPSHYYDWSQTVFADGSGTYDPQKGDIILWVWNSFEGTVSYNTSLSHTAIFESYSVDGDKVTLNFVNGNSGGEVKAGSYTLNKANGEFSNGSGNKVGYFVAPDYENADIEYHTVTFDADGGAVTKASKKIARYGLYGPLPTPVKKESTFLGWYDFRDKKVNMYTPYLSLKDTTLTAHWERGIPLEYLRAGADESSVSEVAGTLKNADEFGTDIKAQIYTYKADGKTYRALYIWGENGKGTIDNETFATVKTIYPTEKDVITDIIMDDTITQVKKQEMFGELTKVSYVRFSENLNELAGKDFWYCTALPEITFPASLEKTGMSTIDGCTSLKVMNFEDGIKKIPDHIADCMVVESQIALETVNIPSSVTEIGESAFSGQKKLTTVNFTDPDDTTLARIAAFAFEETGLNNIALPKFGGFWYDTSNKKRYPEISGLAFEFIQDNNPAFKTFVVPEGVVNLYEFTHDCKFEYLYLPSTLEYSPSDKKDSFGFSLALFYDGASTDKHKALKKIYYPGSEAQFLKKALGATNKTQQKMYKEKCWYDKVVFNAKSPVITASTASIVKYYDDLTEGAKETIDLTISNVNNEEAGYSVSSSDKTIVEGSVGSESGGKADLTLTFHKKKGDATVMVSRGSASLAIKVRIKDKDAASVPYIKLLSGTGKEYGDEYGIYTSSPGAQIFFLIDNNSGKSTVLTDVANYSFNAEAGLYTATNNSISENNTPIVVGRDLTEAKHYVHAVAISGSMRMSGELIKELPYASEDQWGDITDEDKTELGSDPTKIPVGVWAPKSQLSSNALVYTGKAVTIPDLRVYFGNTLLTLKRDYTLKYVNPVNAANASSEKKPTINVSLKGDYSGTEELYYSIKPAVLSADDITYTVVNLNSGQSAAQKADLKLKQDKKALKKGTDYDISFRKAGTTEALRDDVNESGAYDVKIAGKGNYEGGFEILKGLFIMGGDLINMDKVTVSKIKAQNMTDWKDKGYKVTPEFEVTYKGTKLSGNEVTVIPETGQFTYEFRNNASAGMAYLLIRGTGIKSGSDGFIGCKTVSFKINGIPFNKNTVKTKVEAKYGFTGKPVDPRDDAEFSVSCNGAALHENVDYTVNFDNSHINAGKVKMTLTGKGIYSGNAAYNYTIEKVSLTDGTVSVNMIDGVPWKDASAVFSYTRNGVKPEFVITNGGTALEPSDYTVKYVNNRIPLTYNAVDKRNKDIAPAVIIKGKGNYTGTKTLHFTITKADIGKLDMSVDDMVEVKKANKFARKPVITDTNGAVLKPGTDYEKVFGYTYDADVTITRVTGSGRNAVTTTLLRTKGDKVDKRDIIPAGAVIRVTVTGKNNYEKTISDTFTISEKSIKELRFIVNNGPYEYTGRPVTPGKNNITVYRKNAGKWEEITDKAAANRLYDITGYSNNIRKGTAKLTVKAKNGYAGTVKLSFKIRTKARTLGK